MKALRWLLTLFAIATFHSPCPAGGTDGWTELRTPNFRVVSNAAPGATLEIGTGLERLRQALDTFPGGLDQTPRRPLTVYLFRDWRSSKRLIPLSDRGDRPGGLFFRDPDAAYIVIHAEDDLDTASLAYHEYLHYTVQKNLPAVPLWLSEGIAEVFSSFQATEHEAEIGIPIGVYRAKADGWRSFSLEKLSSITPSDWEYREPRLKQQFHAQSWALTHYLMFGPDRAAPLDTSFKRLRNGESVSAVFPVLAAGMPDVLSHLDEPTTPVRVGLTGAAESAHQPRPLPPDEVYRVQADLLLYQPMKQSRLAEKLYLKALRVNESNARAHAGLGRFLARDGRRVEAIEHLRRAVALTPDDRRMAFFLARELSRETR